METTRPSNEPGVQLLRCCSARFIALFTSWPPRPPFGLRLLCAWSIARGPWHRSWCMRHISACVASRPAFATFRTKVIAQRGIHQTSKVELYGGGFVFAKSLCTNTFTLCNTHQRDGRHQMRSDLFSRVVCCTHVQVQRNIRPLM